MCCPGLGWCCDCGCALARGYVALMKELPLAGKIVLLLVTLALLVLAGVGVGMLVSKVNDWYYGDF